MLEWLDLVALADELGTIDWAGLTSEIPGFSFNTYGVLLGLGMTLGELPNSFLKRQFGIPPGQRKGGFWGVLFLVLDQVDLTLGVWFFFFFLVNPPMLLVVWSLALTLGLHLSVSSLGYMLKMRKTPS